MEFFVSPKALEDLKQRMRKFPTFTYMAINKAGDLHTNTNGSKPNAVTWGVFPAREIVQPTIVELSSFDAWKDEAFTLWDQWSKCYAQNTTSRELLSELGQSLYLINIVNNDYHEKEGVFELFKEDFDALRASQNVAVPINSDANGHVNGHIDKPFASVSVKGNGVVKAIEGLSLSVESVAIAQAVPV